MHNIRSALLFGAILVLGATIPAMLGNGTPRVPDRHILAFADNSHDCFGQEPQPGSCPTIYVIDTDDILHRHRNDRALPPEARLVVSHSDPIRALAWSPDGASIAYLVEDRVIEGSYAIAKALDLWVADVASGKNRKVQSAAVPDDVARRSVESSLLRWSDRREVGISPAPRAVTNERRRATSVSSPDGKRIAYHVSGIDSSWICVRAAPTTEEALFDEGCFGDGFFSEPAWSPAGGYALTDRLPRSDEVPRSGPTPYYPQSAPFD